MGNAPARRPHRWLDAARRPLGQLAVVANLVDERVHHRHQGARRVFKLLHQETVVTLLPTRGEGKSYRPDFLQYLLIFGLLIHNFSLSKKFYSIVDQRAGHLAPRASPRCDQMIMAVPGSLQSLGPSAPAALTSTL